MYSIREKSCFDFKSEMIFTKKEIWLLLLPVIFEMLTSYLIGMADSIMVSSVGEAAVSAVSLVDAISILFINVFSALAVGGAVACGQHIGKRDFITAKRAGEHTIFMLFFVSVLLAAVMLIFKKEILGYLYGSLESEVMKNCEIYYGIVMFSVPCIALYNGGAALYRTSGDSRTPLIIATVMNIINVGGNAFLIYVLKMGIEGVAIPTLISRFVGMAAILVLILRKKFVISIRGIFHFRYSGKLFSSILSVGIPNGIENGMFQFGKLVLMSLVSTLSIASITANAIGNTIGSLHCVIGMSANSALMAVVSRCVGAGDYAQARWYTRYFVTITYILQGLFNLLLIAAIPLILRIYGASDETVKLAVPILLLHSISTIFLFPPAFMLNSSMRAAGDSKFAMWVASISMWVFRVGGAYLLVNHFCLGVIGIWIAWIIDWLFRILIFVPRYFGHKWETKAIV